MGNDATAPAALAIVAAQHQVAFDPAQLMHRLGLGGGVALDETQLLVAIRSLGLKGRHTRLTWAGAKRLRAPCLVQDRGGAWATVLRPLPDGRLLMVPPHAPKSGVRPEPIDEEQWNARMGERCILVKRPLRLSDGDRPFDLLWFVPMLARHRGLIGQILLAALFIQVLALVTPLFSQVIIDKVLMHHSLPTLHVLALGMAAVLVFEAVLGALRGYFLAHVSGRLDALLSARLYRHLLSVPLRYFESRRAGDILSRARELETVRHFLTGSATTTALDVLFIGAFIAVMLLYSVTLTLVVLASIPLFVALSIVFYPVLKRRLEVRFDRAAEAHGFMVESVQGIATIKALSIEPVFNRRWENLAAAQVAAGYRVERLAAVSSSLSQAVSRVGTLAVLWVGAWQVMEGALTVGGLIAFQMLAGQVVNPIMRLVQLWQQFQQVGLSVRRLGDLMNTRTEPGTSVAVVRPPLRGEISLERVCFRYSADGPRTLDDFSLRILPGETIGIVGRSGSGKSTVARLIQRLYLPESGRILADGHDIAAADPLWLRRQIGVVPQESFLIAGSIAENIAIASPGAPMQAIERAARLAGAHDFISALPEGYGTQTGERGTALSGGQRQRIAIARALLSDPRILIFDEATSALDAESERLVARNLGEISRGRTTLIIAHRLATLRHADRIIVVERGRILEEGTHDALLSRAGLYARMWHMQEGRPDAHEIGPDYGCLAA
ncbi:MAG: type I secretion system permease/ATPase [Betaproteobacteria bacterium]|nr:type I secretion system permease/ATPase [Betaproteobacteria bacterium]